MIVLTMTGLPKGYNHAMADEYYYIKLKDELIEIFHINSL